MNGGYNRQTNTQNTQLLQFVFVCVCMRACVVVVVYTESTHDSVERCFFNCCVHDCVYFLTNFLFPLFLLYISVYIAFAIFFYFIF